MRKIFGSRVLMGDASYRRRMQGPSYKGVWLTQPQNNWVKLGKSGVSMKLIETNGRYVMSLYYRRFATCLVFEMGLYL